MTRRNTLVRRAFVLDSGGLSGRVISGAGFQFLGIALRTLITIGSTAVLARLLSPSDFGYLAMATVVTEFAALFGNFGFANVLIQRRTITRLQLDTVFWASAALGGALALAVFVASFFAGWLFADPQVGRLLRVLCLSFPLSGLGAYAWVVLARLMRFRTDFWIQITAIATRALVAIGLAYAGFGVWSLVFGALTGVAVILLLSFVAVPYRPRLKFNLAFIRSIMKTSGGYFGSGFLYYLGMNIDLILIGRRLGSAPLGMYQNARSLTDEIRARIAMPIQNVLFPAFSALQNDQARFRQLVMRSGRLLAAVVIPIGFGVSANATELVLTLYGPQWRPMIPVMAMFGLSAAVRAVTSIGSPLFNASNRVGLAFKYHAAYTVLQIVGVALALPHGVEAVAEVVALTTLFTLWALRVSMGLIGLKTIDMVRMLMPPVLASCLLWLATAALRDVALGWTERPPALLAIHVAIGATVYLIALHLFSRQYLQDVRELVARVRQRS